MSSSSSFNPSYSGTLGLLPFLQSGNTASKPSVIQGPIPNADSAALRLSPKDILGKASNTKLGQKQEPLFDTYPNPEKFLSRTKSLSKSVLNAPLQLKLDGNATFDDFIKLGTKGFEIPYYSFDTPYATNAFSDFINTVALGSYVVGTPNYFAEAEFWDGVPLIEGFDGNAYDKDLISKPFSQVGHPQGLSSDDFADLIEQKTSKTATGSSGSGTLNTELLRSTIENANGDSIDVSKELFLALVDKAESGGSAKDKINYQTKSLQSKLSGSYGIKNAMGDGGAGLYSSISNLSGINNLDEILGDTASSYQSATSAPDSSAASSTASNYLGFTGAQASMISGTMAWAKELTSGQSATTAASQPTTPTYPSSSASAMPYANPAAISPAQQLFPYLPPSTPLSNPFQGPPAMMTPGYGLTASQSSILSDSYNFAKQYQMAGIGGTSLLGGNTAGVAPTASYGAPAQYMAPTTGYPPMAATPSAMMGLGTGLNTGLGTHFNTNPYGMSPLPTSNAYSTPSYMGSGYNNGGYNNTPYGNAMPGYAVIPAAVVIPTMGAPTPMPAPGYGQPTPPPYGNGGGNQAIIQQITGLLQQFMGLLGELSNRLPY